LLVREHLHRGYSMPDTQHLALPLMEAAQAQKHVTFNEALTLLDGLVQLSVKSRAVGTPPTSPMEGERYLVASAATGDWSGKVGDVAISLASLWRFVTPQEGWTLWIDDENALLVFDGTSWSPVSSGGSGGAGGAPTDASYIMAASSSGLSGEKVATDSASIVWDFSTPGTAKANVAYGVFASAGHTHASTLQNVGVGAEVLGGWAATTPTGTSNIAQGNQAAGSLTSGASNVAVGGAAQRSNSTGSFNVDVGFISGYQNNGDYNTRVGANNSQASASVDRATAVGAFALQSNLADENVAVGYGSASGLTTGARATAVGTSAGVLQTTQNDFTAVGFNAGGGAHVAADNQLVLGANSFATEANQIALGNDSNTSVRLFGQKYLRKGNDGDVIIGANAGGASPTAVARTIIGEEAGLATNAGSNFGQVVVGRMALRNGTNNQAIVVVGNMAGHEAQNLNDTVLIGDQAGRHLGRHQPVSYDVPADEIHIKAAGTDVTQGLPLPPSIVGATALGKNALRYNTIGQNNTGVGDSALGFTTTGSANTAIGYVCGEGNVTGSYNTFGGQGVRAYLRDGDSNALWGYGIQAGVGSPGDYPAGGSRNAIMGRDAAYSANSSDMAAVGFEAFKNATGNAGGDTGVGARVGASVVTGGDNVFVGVDSGNGASQAANVQNSIAIGADTFTTANNQVRIGNALNTEFWLGPSKFNISGAAQGSLLYRNAAGWVALPAGSAGQVLQTNGAAANPSWATVASGSGSGEVIGLATPTLPADPGAGKITKGDYMFAGRAVKGVRAAFENWVPEQSVLNRVQLAYWQPGGNSSSAPGVLGLAAMQVLGTATARNVATTNRATRKRRLGYVSAATAGALAGHYSNNAQFSLGDGAGNGGLFYACRFVVSDAAQVAGARMFVGLRNATSAPTNVDPSALINCVGVAQVSTSNNLQIVFGGSAAQATIDLGANFPANTLSADAYELTLYSPPGVSNTLHYRVERLGTSFVATGQLGPGTAGVTLPAATTLLAHAAWRTNNATALAVGIDICNIYFEQLD
jgi:hypothetical protein